MLIKMRVSLRFGLGTHRNGYIRNQLPPERVCALGITISSECQYFSGAPPEQHAPKPDNVGTSLRSILQNPGKTVILRVLPAMVTLIS